MDVKLFVRIVKKSFTAYQNLIFTYKFAKKEKNGDIKDLVGKSNCKVGIKKKEVEL